MPEKPTTAAGYPPEQLDRVRKTCLYVASKLGDLMDDVVAVGGLVPSLLIEQNQAAVGFSPHVGTMDLDLGLAFALVGRHRDWEWRPGVTPGSFLLSQTPSIQERRISQEGQARLDRRRPSDPCCSRIQSRNQT